MQCHKFLLIQMLGMPFMNPTNHSYCSAKTRICPCWLPVVDLKPHRVWSLFFSSAQNCCFNAFFSVLTRFRSTWEDHVSDRFFTPRITIKLSIKWQNPHWADFEKAFDRLPYDSVWDTLKCWGIPRKIINIIKSFFGQRAAFTGQEKQTWAYVLS